MEIAVMIVVGLAVLLMIISIFIKDRSKANEREIEELSLNFYQELQQLKKRIKIVEQQILAAGNQLQPMKAATATEVPLKKPENKREKQTPVNQTAINQVILLHKQGVSIDQIVSLSSLSRDKVFNIIQNR
ncbi:hypothetical protein [Jeotgalibacillus proteolyticus]|uniref:Resolvase HTH domain-containing protein n=1 Tax=Jeotgalibacillus proteolyticus TaxID=2082395 RepID=A0A2S5GES6_9BACL|nr:hypothetical protein [Jeotgalibacillus proteolyticus]PPA71415.1 hypothetical protein C4B60_04950 [Jeotgalibacillus proteolyticus]